MAVKSSRYWLIFISPAMFLIAVFLLWPLAKTVVYSFSEWKNFSITYTFAGLANYKRMAADSVIRIALKNSGILIIFALIFQVGFSLLLAILVDSVNHLFKFYRTVYFFPIVISGTAIGLMFALAYKYEYGLLNFFLTLFGQEKRVWITPKTSIFLALIPVVWQYVGFYFVIFLTGLSKIPADVYEAAMLDGVTPIQKAIKITIPMLRDTLVSCTVLVVSGCFRVFDTVFIITKGGPLDSSQFLSTYMYKMAFENFNGGYASAIAMLMIFIGVFITVCLRKALKAQ
ncbi:MAG: sugar ABC transporter permease [Clostridiales bacterium]|nr:sugar ABC transporter permease [Clostridiales bacterium]